jgi:hypothetical protein
VNKVFLREHPVEVFRYVAKKRRTTFREICHDLPEYNREELEGYLQELLDAGLIKTVESWAQMEDFRHYYVSADGLGAARQLGFEPERESYPIVWITFLASVIYFIAIPISPVLSFQLDGWTIFLIVLLLLSSTVLFLHYKSIYKEWRETR